jgi:hypothetical protein
VVLADAIRALNRKFILMEPVVGYRGARDAAGTARGDARRAIVACARMHARFLDDADNLHESTAWMPRSQGVDFIESLARLVAKGFEEPQAHAEVLQAIADRYRTARLTLRHGDFRPGNLLWGDAEPVVLDWDGCGAAPLTWDVTYFMVLGMTVGQRRAWEQELLRDYHGALIAHGVRDYSLTQATTDYLVFRVLLYLYALAAHKIDLFGWNQGHAKADFGNDLRDRAAWEVRVGTSMMDMDAAELAHTLDVSPMSLCRIQDLVAREIDRQLAASEAQTL